MGFIADVTLGFRETSTAFERDVSVDLAVPIEPARPRRRQSTTHVNAAGRFRIIFLPDRIVGREILVDYSSVRLERTNVKGQHPRKIVRLRYTYKSVTLIDLGVDSTTL